MFLLKKTKSKLMYLVIWLVLIILSGHKVVSKASILIDEEILPNMPTARANFATITHGDLIYCIGGYNSSDYFDTVEAFNTKTNKWEIKASLNIPRQGASAEYYRGKIYVFGGENIIDGKKTYLGEVEAYDINTGRWEIISEMPTPRSGLETIILGSYVYTIGGCHFDDDKKHYWTEVLEVYNINSNTWEEKTPMILGKNSFSSFYFDDKIYCIGGYNGVSRLSEVEVYDIGSDSWSIKYSLLNPINSFKTCLKYDDLYLIGGRFSPTNISNKIERYNNNSSSWETIGLLRDNIHGHSAVFLNSKLYVIGGISNGTYIDYASAYDISEYKFNDILNNIDKYDVDSIGDLREFVNSLEEGPIKDNLQTRINNIFIDMTFNKEEVTANMDVYIKSENMLSMSLDTNSVSFDGYSGVTDMEKLGAVNITINSSLPYDLNAYIPTEISNSDGSAKIPFNVFSIRENSEGTYKQFTNTTDNVLLKDGCLAGNGNTHVIDLKLSTNQAHTADIYKTVIRFEAHQK